MDQTVHVDQLWPDDGATFRAMTRLLTSAKAICVNLSQVAQFSRIPYNARLCWTANKTPVFLQQSQGGQQEAGSQPEMEGSSAVFQ